MKKRREERRKGRSRQKRMKERTEMRKKRSRGRRMVRSRRRTLHPKDVCLKGTAQPVRLCSH